MWVTTHKPALTASTIADIPVEMCAPAPPLPQLRAGRGSLSDRVRARAERRRKAKHRRKFRRA